MDRARPKILMQHRRHIALLRLMLPRDLGRRQPSDAIVDQPRHHHLAEDRRGLSEVVPVSETGA